MIPVNLAEKLSTFTETFQPRTVGQFNGHDLMVVKVKGEFVWHKHDDTDDFFLVLNGRLTIQMRDGNVTLGPGEMFASLRSEAHIAVGYVSGGSSLTASAAASACNARVSSMWIIASNCSTRRASK